MIQIKAKINPLKNVDMLVNIYFKIYKVYNLINHSIYNVFMFYFLLFVISRSIHFIGIINTFDNK